MVEQFMRADADGEKLFVDEIKECQIGEHIARGDGEPIIGQKMKRADTAPERVGADDLMRGSVKLGDGARRFADEVDRIAADEDAVWVGGQSAQVGWSERYGGDRAVGTVGREEIQTFSAVITADERQIQRAA